MRVANPRLKSAVTWAQRSSASDPERNYLYVNIKAADVPRSDAKLDITAKNVTFSGPSRKGVTYKVSLDLYAEIEPENSKVNHSDRDVELVLRKKELKEEFWPRLLETTQKVHFLKTNFEKVRPCNSDFDIENGMLTTGSGWMRTSRTRHQKMTMPTTSAGLTPMSRVALATLTSRNLVVFPAPVALAATSAAKEMRR